MANEQAPPEPKPIPDPPDFPIVWDNPDDAQLQWEYDSAHLTGPLSLLDYHYWIDIYEGFNAYNESAGNPLRFKTTRLNTFLYGAVVPVVAPEEIPEAMNKAEQTIKGQIDQLGTLWKEDWLPEIKGHLAFWDAFDLRGSNAGDLMVHLEETVVRMRELWEIHFAIVLPAYVAMSQFDDLYRDLFGSEGAFDAYRLLQGLDNETVVTDRALWVLGRRALQSPQIREAIETHKVSDIPSSLEAFPEGRTFWSDFQDFLAERSQRTTTWSIAEESWIENPEQPLVSLKEYLSQPDRDMEEERAALVADREKATTVARERLKGYPQQVSEEFERLLEAAQCGIVLSEDHGFWIDFACSYRLRTVLVELGVRLSAAGALDTANDVFHLSLDELRAACADPGTANLLDDVARRRAEISQWEKVTPPPMLGTDYGITRGQREVASGRCAGRPDDRSPLDTVVRDSRGHRDRQRGCFEPLRRRRT